MSADAVFFGHKHRLRTCLRPALLVAIALAVASAARAGCDVSQPESAPVSRYVIKAGEVYDKNTRLTWQRCSVGQRWKEGLGCVGVILQLTWKEAMLRESAMWRLPTSDELATLVAANCANPAINEEVFPDMELLKLWYWTSTQSGGSVNYVAFAGGSVHGGGATDLNAVRLVKK